MLPEQKKMAGVYREIYYHVAKIALSLGKDLASMNYVKQNGQQFLHQLVKDVLDVENFEIV